jgi:glycosyltransferase involved in cell wall biosynthesis
MKVLHLTWSDRHGGAGRAASRLNSALQQTEIKSAMLSAAGHLDEEGRWHPITAMDQLLTRASARLDQVPLVKYPRREKTLFSPAWAPDRLASRLRFNDADVFHLHWINNGFIRIETLCSLRKPIVWTFHDMWPVTGGCHYSSGCQKFAESCGECPRLHSHRTNDLSLSTFLRKKAVSSQCRINVVTPSRWLADVASSSELMRDQKISTIPNSIDTDAFVPLDKGVSRAEFGLPQDSTILLFGALTGDGDTRKGFHFMLPLLARLAEEYPRKKIHLAILGMTTPPNAQDFMFPTTYLGILRDDQMIARAYSSADVLVVPSIEDNLPNSVMEAGSCGIPSVAFRAGGLPDMIEHMQSGYLAQPFEVQDLAAGVSLLIREPQRASQAGAFARKHVVGNYSYGVVARQHADLYSGLLVN